MLHIPSYPESTIGPTMVGPEENLSNSVEKFQSKSSQMARKQYLRLMFANAVFHKRTILLTFEAKFNENILNILLYLEPATGPIMVGPAEKAQSIGFQMAGIGYFDIGFWNYSKYFL